MDNKNKLLVGGCLLISIDWSNHQANGFERVETSAILRPENAILKFAAVDPSTVPNTVQVGLATRVVPPAALMEVSAVTWRNISKNNTMNTVRVHYVTSKPMSILIRF